MGIEGIKRFSTNKTLQPITLVKLQEKQSQFGKSLNLSMISSLPYVTGYKLYVYTLYANATHFMTAIYKFNMKVKNNAPKSIVYKKICELGCKKSI